MRGAAYYSDMSSPRPPHPLHLLSLLLLVLVPLFIVGEIAEDLFEKQRFAFETPLMQTVHAHTTPALLHLSVFLHHLGGPVVMGGVFVLIPVVLWLLRQRHLALFSLVGLGGAVVLNGLMKLFFHRARPELWPRVVVENGPSFPSGHSMFAAALMTVLTVLAWRTPWRWPMLVFGVLYTLTMCSSRLVLGVHYPTDVLAGVLAGLAWIYGVYRLLGGREGYHSATPLPAGLSTEYPVGHDVR